MSLPTEWEACAGIEGVEIKLDGGSLLFRDAELAKTGPAIVAFWVRPPSVHSTTPVQAWQGRAQVRLGRARTFPRARDLVKAHLGR